MPIIAPMKESVAMQPSNPVPISSSEDARMSGESIAKAGAGLANLGAGLNEFFQETDRVARANTVDGFRNAAREFAFSSLQNAETTDTTPDGSGMVPSYTKQMDDWIKEKSKTIDDSTTRERAINAANDVKIDHLSQIVPLAMKKRLDYAYKTGEENVGSSSAWIRQNPDQYDREKQDWQTRHEATGNFYGSNKQPIQELADNEFAKAAIDGFISKGRFDDARKFVTTTGGQFLRADKAEIDKAYTDIDNAQWSLVSRRHTEEQLQSQESKRKREEQQEFNLYRLFPLAAKAQTPAERKKIIDVSNSLFAAKGLDEKGLRFIETTMNKSVGTHDDDISLKFSQRMMNGENYNHLREEVMDAAISGQYGADSALRQLGKLKQIQDQEKKDPDRAIQFRAAQKKVNAFFGSEGFINLFHENTRKVSALANEEFIQLSTVGGKSPFEAANIVIQKYKPKIDQLPIVPGGFITPDEQFTKEGLASARIKLEQAYRTKQVTAKQAKDYAQIIRDREAALSIGEIK